ncbi:proline-rich domain-containing protein [Glycomyces paridis]|uniref:Septum formation-related domain-containing protein n=1 Tax=Glycomyces paridis TaxID=2126555 RepID=A0A4S8P9S1_9ACTN|nr:proline-rich domain-containing protein [Glycomyces paridis]THV27023.1 hypothetical protein E9998_16210 [Glycomyces paridis]
MTVPPNYGPPPEQPQTPGYGYQSQPGGPSPYGGQQPQFGSGPQYGAAPQFGQDPAAPYGGPLPPEPPKRNLGLIGAIIVGVTVLVLGATLLITMNLRGDKDEDKVAGEETETSESASEEETSPGEETTTEEAAATEVGQCLPYEPEILGDGLSLVDCSDATAFWEITAQTYDVGDVTVDDDGNLTDTAPAIELCGAEWGENALGEAWTNWHYVYSNGYLDSLYCIQATGAADPAEPEHLPYIPDTGDCFDKSDDWWTVSCDSDLAVYKVVDTVVYDDPVDMSEEEAKDEATCGGDWYWQIKDTQGWTTAIICANEV